MEVQQTDKPTTRTTTRPEPQTLKVEEIKFPSRPINIKVKIFKNTTKVVLEGYDFNGHYITIREIQAADQTGSTTIEVDNDNFKRITSEEGEWFELTTVRVGTRRTKKTYLKANAWTGIAGTEAPENDDVELTTTQEVDVESQEENLEEDE
eukprot:GAHX01000450.1.p1 GENE.GAHX01000450.1~~GAHX01000450.1.p1  ORF type:complete len:162 (+),score=33.93 GAHX01000450.1:35-487(+)